MSKMAKMIATLGVVAGLGVAAMPLSSYAAVTEDSATVNITAVVGDSISVQTSTDDVDMGTLWANSGLATKDITVTVNTSSKKGYKLEVKDSDDNTALVELDENTNLPKAGGATIPAGDLSSDNSGTGGSNFATASNWGYSVNGGAYKAITTGNTDVRTITKTGATGDEYNNDDTDTKVTFGVRIGDGQTPGTYRGGVIFTATANS